MSPPVVVGAGPAGIRATQTLVAHGLRPVLIDEAERAGGQIYRRPPVNFGRTAAQLYGTEARRATNLHAAADGLSGHIDYRPNSLVWNAVRSEVDVLHTSTGVTSTVRWGRLILATGATDRVLPIEGWTLPGVYSLGGAQIALKYQGCAIGTKVVLMGTGPLLYLVAYQYATAGACVVAVLDTSSLATQGAALPALLSQPATFAKGLFYVAWLLAHRIPVYRGVRPLRIAGDDRVQTVTFLHGGVEKKLACDSAAFGYALRSETQLADLLGCRFAFSDLNRAYLPERDDAGRSSVEGVYLAGDGAGIMGADAAEWAGELAALALLADEGVATDLKRVRKLQKRLAGVVAFRRGLERAFPFPADWAAHVADDLIICRCENISASELRQVACETNADELNRLKAMSRVGMGRCQGRMCGVAAAELLAHAHNISIEQVGRLRGQVPVKPISLGALAAQEQQA